MNASSYLMGYTQGQLTGTLIGTSVSGIDSGPALLGYLIGFILAAILMGAYAWYDGRVERHNRRYFAEFEREVAESFRRSLPPVVCRNGHANTVQDLLDAERE